MNPTCCRQPQSEPQTIDLSLAAGLVGCGSALGRTETAGAIWNRSATNRRGPWDVPEQFHTSADCYHQFDMLYCNS